MTTVTRPNPTAAGSRLLTLVLAAVVVSGLVGCADGAASTADAGAEADGAGADTATAEVEASPPSVDPSSPAAEAGPPAVEPDTVLRPTFDTGEGPVAAGTVFLVRWDDGRILMLTAQHLFGEAGGMSRDYTGAELPDLVDGVTAVSTNDGGVTVTSNELVTIPDAVTDDITHDLAAFVVQDQSSAHVLTLADRIPEPGEPVFLLAQAADGSEPRLYPAIVNDLGEDNGTYLDYMFTAESGMTDDLMPGTSGAPILNANGAVVGLQKGGGEETTGATYGIANPVHTIRQALEANL